MRLAAVERLARDPTCLLTPDERDQGARLKHVSRHREWLAGRVVAKWLFLRHVDRVAHPAHGTAWPPTAYGVGPEALDALPGGEYRRIEILRAAGGAPRLSWSAAPHVEAGARVSIAHRGGWVMAAISSGGAIGVDIEAVEPRRPSFHDACLTASERRWLGRAAAADVSPLATLLWTLKEACLKTGASRAHSVWDIDAIDCRISTPPDVVARSWRRREAHLFPVALDVALAVDTARLLAAHGVVGPVVFTVVALVPHARAAARRTGPEHARISHRVAISSHAWQEDLS